jgi:hypothetical protein
MTFSDSRWRALEEAAVLARGTGRPRNSPGWGMLVATRSGEFSPERDPSERVTITAGTTRVRADYWLARERPELFKLADRRDTRTYRSHTRNLEHARQELERGRPNRARRRTDALKLPGQPFRLPRHYTAFKLPRRTTTGRVLP